MRQFGEEQGAEEDKESGWGSVRLETPALHGEWRRQSRDVGNCGPLDGSREGEYARGASSATGRWHSSRTISSGHRQGAGVDLGNIWLELGATKEGELGRGAPAKRLRGSQGRRRRPVPGRGATGSVRCC